MLAVLIGPGGVGKGTIAQRLIDADENLWLSRSWTTRPQRASERGDEYVFVDAPTFERAIAEGRFLEWARFHDHLYGTPLPKAPAERDVLLEIEVQGAEQVRGRYPDAVVILITPPSDADLEGRLRARGDADEHVQKRLSSAPDEVTRGQELANFVVVNDDLERATNEILSILEGLRQQRRSPSSKD
ncbi:MAG TPA: guanylate kinase [Acidimicrobiales bacterium]